MRILVDIPLHFNIPESVLEELHVVLLKARDALPPIAIETTAAEDEQREEDKTFLNQFITQIEQKLAYIRSRPAEIAERIQYQKDRRDEILQKIKNDQQLQEQATTATAGNKSK